MTILQLAFDRGDSGQILFDASGYPRFDAGANAGANTYGQLQARVKNEVLGSPTPTDIQNAIGDAIQEYERETFWFNTSRYFGDIAGSGSDLSTVQGKEFYSYQDLPLLINAPHISKILVLAYSNRYPLFNRTNQWIDDQSLSSTWRGMPTDWSWIGGSVRLFPVPDAVYPLILDATIRFAPLTNDADYNCWTNEAERLIRIEAKRLLFRDIIRDDGQVAAMEAELMGNPAAGRQGALAQLRRESSRRSGGSGKLRASRSYM